MMFILLRLILISVIGFTFIIAWLGLTLPKQLYHNQLSVLMYHHVHDDDRSANTISSQLFREQLIYLKNKGYQFITMNDLKQFLQGAPIADNAVLVTFDDGYEGFYTYAFPVLEELQIPAVNFIITKTLDAPLDDIPPKLSREQIHSMMVQSNLIDVQCHTDSLHNKNDNGKALLIGHILTEEITETDLQYKQRIIQDTQTCLSKLKLLNPLVIDSLAYPYGIYNEASASLVKQAGIKFAFTIQPGMTTRRVDPLKIPRINAGSPKITPESLHQKIVQRVKMVE